MNNKTIKLCRHKNGQDTILELTATIENAISLYNSFEGHGQASFSVRSAIAETRLQFLTDNFTDGYLSYLSPECPKKLKSNDVYMIIAFRGDEVGYSALIPIKIKNKRQELYVIQSYLEAYNYEQNNIGDTHARSKAWVSKKN